MKTLFFVAAGILGLLVTGCSSGNSSTESIEGTWSRASIGLPGQAQSALTACPTSVTVSGATVTCGSSDLLAFRPDQTATVYLIDAPTGNPVRLIGTYARDSNKVTMRPTQVATDHNRDGVFDASETVSTDPSTRLDLNIRMLSSSQLLVEFTLDGVVYTSLYNRQFTL